MLAAGREVCERMRVLLTGTAGFIGSHLAHALLGRGHLVEGLDNLNDSYDVRLKEWRLEQIRPRRGFSFSCCDITDFASLSDRWQRCGPFDAVVNLAARSGVRQSLTDPWAYLSTNAAGTLNLLELCRRSGTKKFVLASSSSVYGRTTALPFREDQPVNTPLSPYAASKIAAEGIAHSYHHLYAIDISVLRYFTVYGPAGRPDMSPFRFVRWISEGEPVKILGDGSQSRDYTFVGDIVEGTIAALDPVGFGIFNLGSDSPASLMAMAHHVEDLTGRTARYEFQPGQKTDVQATWADIARARERFGWEPRTRLHDGLEATVRWYRDNRRLALSLAL